MSNYQDDRDFVHITYEIELPREWAEKQSPSYWFRLGTAIKEIVRLSDATNLELFPWVWKVDKPKGEK